MATSGDPFGTLELVGVLRLPVNCVIAVVGITAASAEDACTVVTVAICPTVRNADPGLGTLSGLTGVGVRRGVGVCARATVSASRASMIPLSSSLSNGSCWALNGVVCNTPLTTA